MSFRRFLTDTKIFRDWREVLIFLVLTRLLLIIPAAIGASQAPLRAGVPPNLPDPAIFPNLWARWDSEFYLQVSAEGLPRKGQELAFFPMYSLLIRFFSLGIAGLSVWMGYLISNISFILGSLFLWRQVKGEFSPGVAWATVITLSLFPTSLFFSAVYSEGIFLLFSVLVYWFSVREKYGLAALFVGLGALTKVPGILLIVIPLVEMIQRRSPRIGYKILYTCFISGIGLGLYGAYLRLTRGSPFAFMRVQTTFGRKALLSWPWKSFLDSLRVALFGYGGTQNDWLSRLTSASEVLAVILFGACLIGVFFWLRKSLFIYSGITLLLLLVSHGPSVLGLWSMDRYVLALFPCFIVMGIVLKRIPLARWVWLASLGLLLYLTAVFANGRWVS